MIGAQIGPYRVESELGSGGMGTVYLAEVTAETPVLEQGKRIALKIVHPHLLATPGFFKRFLQEAEAGKRIRHENVVRTYEVDATLHEDRQVNYMAMEYVEGGSLRELLIQLRSTPESLLREIAVQIAAGLAAIHAEGIVHRDLKPENVLITDDQQVRIMDLGVAKLQEASIALTREGQFTGSLLYAPPEQCEGRNVGAPADLYALGVMLYELATGENPFRRGDAVAVIKAQISFDPPRATERSPDLSSFFAELIATLMAKDPQKRFASAEELHSVLVEAEHSAWWAEREQQLHTIIAELPSIQVRRETGLHGREDEMKALRTLWRKAKEGHGNMLFVEGEAGLGKSRLVDAFLRSLKGDDAHVLYGSYPPSGGLGGLSEAILGKFGTSGLTENIAQYMSATPTLVPAFAALIRHESAPTGSEPMQGDALHAVVCNIMRQLAEEKPTIWVIEDLQFAPSDSRDLLLSMARALGPHRVLLIGTSRPGLREDEIAHLSRLEHFKRIQLGRLGARDVIELLQDAFKSAVLAEKLGGKIAYKSDGVPFFVFEMIRGLKEGQFLTQSADGSYVQTQMITDIEVPSAVKDLIEGRLRGLSEDQRAILDVGAVQGYSFDPGLAAAVLEEKKVRVLRDLAEIERRYGIVRGEAGACRFDQYQIQEVLYKDLMPDLRTEYHALLADAYAEKKGLEAEGAGGADAHFMARHHLKGSRPKEALPYLDKALDYLRASYQNDAAVELIQRAMNVPAQLENEYRIELMLRLAGLLSDSGRRKEERSTVDEALRLADSTGNAKLRVRARIAVQAFHDQTSNYEKSLEYARQAVDIAPDAGEPVLEASAQQSLGLALHKLGRNEEAIIEFGRQREIYQKIGDVAGGLAATGNLGVTYWSLGRYRDRKECHERRMAYAAGKGGRGEAIAAHNLANVYSDLGRLGEARELQDRALQLARLAGFRRIEAFALYELGNGAERAGESGAAELYKQAVVVFEEIGYRATVAEALIALGRIAASTGDTARALSRFDEAIDISRELHVHGTHQLAAGWRALVSGEGASAAGTVLEEHGPAILHHHRLEGHFVLWKATREPQYLEKAHRQLCHLRDHAPGEYRESMIENIPLNRDIMAAWEEHGTDGDA